MNRTEQKRQRQQDKRQQESQQVSQQRLRQAAIWGLPVLLLLVVGYFVYQIFAAPASLAGEVTAGDHVKGNPDAAVVMVEYSDFQCPACGYYAGQIKEAWPAIKDDVKFVYRHFPLSSIHPNADLAAAYAEAASLQGKFWEMHDELFENQTQWSDLSDPAAAFDRYASRVGLDVDKLHEDLDNPELQAKIRADVRGASQSGVNSTPSFFVNGQRMSNPQTAAGFVYAIREAAQ